MASDLKSRVELSARCINSALYEKGTLYVSSAKMAKDRLGKLQPVDGRLFGGRTSAPVLVEDEESSKVRSEAVQSTREVQAEAEAHSPRKGTISRDAVKIIYFELSKLLLYS